TRDGGGAAVGRVVRQVAVDAGVCRPGVVGDAGGAVGRAGGIDPLHGVPQQRVVGVDARHVQRGLAVALEAPADLVVVLVGHDHRVHGVVRVLLVELRTGLRAVQRRMVVVV